MSHEIPFKFDGYSSVESLAKAFRSDPNIFFQFSKTDLLQHRIPKKNLSKGYRVVWEVQSEKLQEILEIFHVEYLKFARAKIAGFPHPCSHGFHDKKSIISNAKPHAGKYYLLKADIKNFFNSITRNQIKDCFLKMGIIEEIAEVLSNILTVDEALPQGFCTSPMVSNLIFFNLDEHFFKLSQKYNCQYTRYADDITFSSNNMLPTREEIANILQLGGFELEPNKFSYKKKGQALYVTGLSVSDVKPRVSRSWKHELRQELYFIEKFGLVEHAGRKNYPTVQSCINKISGKINFLKGVEPEKAAMLKQKLSTLPDCEQWKVNYQARGKPAPRDLTLYIDEFEKNGIIFLCLALVEDVELIEQKIKKIYCELSEDEFLPQKRNVFNRESLHWNELSQDARRALITSTSHLPFKAFVVCTNFDRNYKKEYKILFRDLLQHRYCSLDGDNINIFVESNTIITQNELQKISDDIYSLSKKVSSRRPSNQPVVNVCKKEEIINFILPDCLLGVLGDYIFKSEDNKNQLTGYEAKYNQLKPKFRCIKCLLNDSFYSFTRSRPLSRAYFHQLFNK